MTTTTTTTTTTIIILINKKRSKTPVKYDRVCSQFHCCWMRSLHGVERGGCLYIKLVVLYGRPLMLVIKTVQN